MKAWHVVVLVVSALVAVTARMAGNREIIVGGQPAPAGRYPWMVGQLKTRNNRPYCGGVLVTSNVVYTAAHCAEPPLVAIGCRHIRDKCARVRVT